MYKIGDKFDLKEAEKNILSKKEENGYDDQYFKKEDIEWVIFDIDEEKGEMLLISAEPTEQELTLQGKEGWENHKKVLDKLCKEITGIENARSLDYMDIYHSKYWEDTKKRDLIFKSTPYWLASPCVNAYFDDSDADFSVRYVNSTIVNAYYMFNSNDGSNYRACAVRPVVSVSLKSNIHDSQE